MGPRYTAYNPRIKLIGRVLGDRYVALDQVTNIGYSEGDLINGFVKAQPNPVADWKEMFGQGSQPSTDASQYPPIDDVLAKFEGIRAATLDTLASMTDDDLDKPSQAPEEAKEYFGTIGHCFAALSMHFTYHGGQVADARRAAGRQPLMG